MSGATTGLPGGELVAPPPGEARRVSALASSLCVSMYPLSSCKWLKEQVSGVNYLETSEFAGSFRGGQPFGHVRALHRRVVGLLQDHEELAKHLHMSAIGEECLGGGHRVSTP